MRVALVSNPQAGSYSPALVARLCDEFRGQGAEVTEAECSPRQAFLPPADVDRICVVGGDGTMRHVVAAVMRADCTAPLIVYPGGTVNLTQIEVGQPRDIAAFVRVALIEGRPRPHFAAMANDQPCLVCTSVGPDAEAVAAVSQTLKARIGRLAYVIAFVGVLLRWPQRRLCLRIDDAVHDCAAVYVAKGRYFAGPWSFAPEAYMERPALEVVWFARMTRWCFLRFAWAMVCGRSVAALPGATAQTCSALAIASDLPLPVQVDGDVVTRLPLRLAVCERPYMLLRWSAAGR